MDCVNNQLQKYGLQPINKSSVISFYLPLKGSINYGMLTAQMFAPEAFENFNFLIVPRYISLTNACLANSLVGSGLYIYSRTHMKSASTQKKIMYSVMGSGMFNLGSVLAWALCRNVLSGDSSSNSSIVNMAIGGLAACVTLKVAKSYLDDVDAQVATK